MQCVCVFRDDICFMFTHSTTVHISSGIIHVVVSICVGAMTLDSFILALLDPFMILPKVKSSKI